MFTILSLASLGKPGEYEPVSWRKNPRLWEVVHFAYGDSVSELAELPCLPGSVLGTGARPGCKVVLSLILDTGEKAAELG